MQKKKKKVGICTDTIQGFLFIIEFVIEFVQGFIYIYIYIYNRICMDTKFEIQEFCEIQRYLKWKQLYPILSQS